MKTVLLVDDSSKGHHVPYLQGISGICSNAINIIVLAPSGCEISGVRVLESKWAPVCRNGAKYFKWLAEIREVARCFNVDIIHFVNADVFRPFFGFGLHSFEQTLVATFHNVEYSVAREFSLIACLSAIDVAVVHAPFLQSYVQFISKTRVRMIDYPPFEFIGIDDDFIPSPDRWKLDPKKRTLACLGATRKNKGIDILLRALTKVKKPFNLLIAGEEAGISKNIIRELSKSYQESVCLHLSHLSEQDLVSAVLSADYLVLPYRKSHNGISGPLSLGVAAGKGVIGPNHGSLGMAISCNHIGYTFETEDENELARVVERALDEKFVYDEVATAYKKSLTLERFHQNYLDLYCSL